MTNNNTHTTNLLNDLDDVLKIELPNQFDSPKIDSQMAEYTEFLDSTKISDLEHDHIRKVLKKFSKMFSKYEDSPLVALLQAHHSFLLKVSLFFQERTQERTQNRIIIQNLVSSIEEEVKFFSKESHYINNYIDLFQKSNSTLSSEALQLRQQIEIFELESAKVKPLNKKCEQFQNEILGLKERLQTMERTNNEVIDGLQKNLAEQENTFGNIVTKLENEKKQLETTLCDLQQSLGFRDNEIEKTLEGMLRLQEKTDNKVLNLQKQLSIKTNDYDFLQKKSKYLLSELEESIKKEKKLKKIVEELEIEKNKLKGIINTCIGLLAHPAEESIELLKDMMGEKV
eukprot:TRINITY_DN1596_c0_g1_i1.p1 TRINITY_DN1596_c0_g1~~TRINITY_DN1596_c0_g1_i1.p1  ORF type:complete len:342 (+),score=120.99 TRINITY_DN1596_c0_g1_i1:66-1091(+)